MSTASQEPHLKLTLDQEAYKREIPMIEIIQASIVNGAPSLLSSSSSSSSPVDQMGMAGTALAYSSSSSSSTSSAHVKSDFGVGDDGRGGDMDLGDSSSSSNRIDSSNRNSDNIINHSNGAESSDNSSSIRNSNGGNSSNNNNKISSRSSSSSYGESRLLQNSKSSDRGDESDSDSTMSDTNPENNSNDNSNDNSDVVIRNSRSRSHLEKISWTKEEDDVLQALVKKHGIKSWTVVSESFCNRTGKHCRERWLNHLNPELKKGEWSTEDDNFILKMQKELGNQWAKITKSLPGRTDNAVKNRFYAIHRAERRKLDRQRNMELMKSKLKENESIKLSQQPKEADLGRLQMLCEVISSSQLNKPTPSTFLPLLSSLSSSSSSLSSSSAAKAVVTVSSTTSTNSAVVSIPSYSLKSRIISELGNNLRNIDNPKKRSIVCDESSEGLGPRRKRALSF